MDRPSLFGVQSALLIIVVGLAISIFVGVGIRSFAASPDLKRRVIEAAGIDSSMATFEFSTLHLNLSNGWLPDFSLRTEKLSIFFNKPCLQGSRLEATQLRFPFRFLSLVFGPPKWGKLHAEQLSISLSETGWKCVAQQKSTRLPNTVDEEAESIPYETEAKPSEPRKKGGFDFAALKSLSKELTGLHFETILLEAWQQPSVRVQGFTVDLADSSLEIEFALTPDPGWTYGEELQNVRLESVVTPEKASVQMVGRWRESFFELNAESDGMDLKLTTAIQNLPVAPLSRILVEQGVLGRAFLANNMWLTCRSSVEGPYQKLRQSRWKLSECSVEGGAAEISFGEMEVLPAESFVSPVSLKIQSFHFAKMLEALGMPHPSRSLGRLGWFEGEAEWHGPDSFNVAGNWHGLEMIFSNRGFRQTQRVDRMRLKLSRQLGYYFLSLSDVNLNQGRMIGELTASTDLAFENGTIRANVDDLLFAPAVQQLIFEGTVAPATFKGEVRVADRKPILADVRLQIPRIMGERIFLREGALHLTREKENWLFGTSIQELQFREGTRGYTILQDLLPERKEFPLANIGGEILVGSNDNLEWRNFDARLEKDRLRSSGKWNEVGQLSGRVSLSQGGKKSLWSLRGTRSKPEFVGTPRQ